MAGWQDEILIFNELLTKATGRELDILGNMAASVCKVATRNHRYSAYTSSVPAVPESLEFLSSSEV